MAKGYWIAEMDVTDPQAYETYRAANGAPLAEFGGKFLVRGGPQTPMEGAPRGRTVVIEFPSYADALACYESDSYQQAKALRDGASDGQLVIVEGYEG